MGIEAIYPKPNLSRRNKEHKVYPYLLRNILIDRPLLKDYQNGKELYSGLEEYCLFYNTQRPHQSLGNKVPEDIHCRSMVNRPPTGIHRIKGAGRILRGGSDLTLVLLALKSLPNVTLSSKQVRPVYINA